MFYFRFRHLWHERMFIPIIYSFGITKIHYNQILLSKLCFIRLSIRDAWIRRLVWLIKVISLHDLHFQVYVSLQVTSGSLCRFYVILVSIIHVHVSYNPVVPSSFSKRALLTEKSCPLDTENVYLGELSSLVNPVL